VDAPPVLTDEEVSTLMDAIERGLVSPWALLEYPQLAHENQRRLDERPH
jgi:hypothetical protein